PGTFTETGSGTIGPQVYLPGEGIAMGTIETFEASFSIDFPGGQVTGTKSLPAPYREFLSGGNCVTPSPGSPFAGLTFSLPTAQYTAQIQTAAGTSTDGGQTTVSIYQGCAARCANIFEDHFASSGPAECGDGLVEAGE